MPRHQAMQLWDLEATADWLIGLLGTPHQLATLRDAFGRDPRFQPFAELDDPGLITRVAHLLVTGELWLIPGAAPMSGGAQPWTWRFPTTPTFPTQTGGRGDPGENPLAQEDDPSEEEDTAPVEEEPEPEIPPVYPEIAKKEARAIHSATELMNLRMEMLKHLRDSMSPTSEVAKHFRSLALSQGKVLEDAAGLLASRLAPLSRGSGKTMPTSMVAGAFRDVAKAQSDQLMTLSTRLGLTLEGLVQGGTKAVESSDVAKMYQEFARQHGTALQRMAEALATMLGSVS